jgi:hypothetical protein
VAIEERPVTKISEATFDALVRRVGLTLTTQQRVEIYRAYGTIEDLTQRLRRKRPLASEPATIFTFDKNATP